eukprot:gene22335-29413_t
MASSRTPQIFGPPETKEQQATSEELQGLNTRASEAVEKLHGLQGQLKSGPCALRAPLFCPGLFPWRGGAEPDRGLHPPTYPQPAFPPRNRAVMQVRELKPLCDSDYFQILMIKVLNADLDVVCEVASSQGVLAQQLEVLGGASKECKERIEAMEANQKVLVLLKMSGEVPIAVAMPPWDRHEATPSGGPEEAKPSEETHEDKPPGDLHEATPSGGPEEAKPSGDPQEAKPNEEPEEAVPSGDLEEAKPSGDLQEAKPNEDPEEAKPSGDLEEAKPSRDPQEAKPTEQHVVELTQVLTEAQETELRRAEIAIDRMTDLISILAREVEHCGVRPFVEDMDCYKADVISFVSKVSNLRKGIRAASAVAVAADNTLAADRLTMRSLAEELEREPLSEIFEDLQSLLSLAMQNGTVTFSREGTATASEISEARRAAKKLQADAESLDSELLGSETKSTETAAAASWHARVADLVRQHIVGKGQVIALRDKINQIRTLSPRAVPSPPVSPVRTAMSLAATAGGARGLRSSREAAKLLFPTGTRFPQPAPYFHGPEPPAPRHPKYPPGAPPSPLAPRPVPRKSKGSKAYLSDADRFLFMQLSGLVNSVTKADHELSSVSTRDWEIAIIKLQRQNDINKAVQRQNDIDKAVQAGSITPVVAKRMSAPGRPSQTNSEGGGEPTLSQPTARKCSSSSISGLGSGGVSLGRDMGSGGLLSGSGRGLNQTSAMSTGGGRGVSQTSGLSTGGGRGVHQSNFMSSGIINRRLGGRSSTGLAVEGSDYGMVPADSFDGGPSPRGVLPPTAAPTSSWGAGGGGGRGDAPKAELNPWLRNQTYRLSKSSPSPAQEERRYRTAAGGSSSQRWSGAEPAVQNQQQGSKTVGDPGPGPGGPPRKGGPRTKGGHEEDSPFGKNQALLDSLYSAFKTSTTKTPIPHTRSKVVWSTL